MYLTKLLTSYVPRIHHQRSRYVYELFFKRRAISRGRVSSLISGVSSLISGVSSLISRVSSLISRVSSLISRVSNPFTTNRNQVPRLLVVEVHTCVC